MRADLASSNALNAALLDGSAANTVPAVITAPYAEKSTLSISFTVISKSAAPFR